MSVLDSIIQMRNQGYPDDEIISQLREQGFSPKEINDALSHSEIKNAISGMEQEEAPAPSPSRAGKNEDVYNPQVPEQGYSPYSQPSVQEYYPQENYAGGYAAAGMSADTIVEICEQVFSEKIKNMQKIVDDMTEFKSLSQTKMENAVDRLKKIEAIIDRLQMSILEKIGSYGSNIEGIKKEMSMMQDSFSKLVGEKIKRTGHEADEGDRQRTKSRK